MWIRSIIVPVAVSTISRNRLPEHPQSRILSQILFGVGGRIRTGVLPAFISKGLQQYFYLLRFLIYAFAARLAIVFTLLALGYGFFFLVAMISPQSILE